MKTLSPIQALVFHSHGVGQLLRLPTLPRDGETVWTSSWEIGSDGGKGSNVAVALSKLGISTAFAGKVGTDIWGEIGLDWLKKSQVDLQYLFHDPDMSTLIGMVLVDDTGQNSIVLGGSCTHFTDEEIHTVIDAYSSAECVITGFEIQISDALEIARYAKASGKYVILNPSPVPKEDIGPLPFLDLLILNQSECECLISLRGSVPDSAPRKQILQLQQLYQCPQIILTLGNDGSLLLEHGDVSFFPSMPVAAVDTSGAGDSFLAAVTACKLHGYPLDAACRFATLYASLTVQKPGTFPAFATREYLLENYPEYSSPLL